MAARRPGAFPTDRREMLGVIANQVAISLQNGRMYQALEEQATTDGLTGLVNHRTFQERFSAMLARAERHNFAVALLLTDIDHFKKINDTYGHPTGDEVLRRVAALLKASARKIDIAARYGGEEFALVLEATDRDGALQLAERIRQEVGQQMFESSKGPFKATLSLGIAVYPDDGRAKAELIKNADTALYAAKHGGRNRTVALRRSRDDGPKRRPRVKPRAMQPSGSMYLFAKALHVVGFVSWFAGLFYIVRLFIYHVEAAARPEPERSLLHAQFTLMERRLWLAITVPAMVITVVFGGCLAYTYLSAVAPGDGAAWLLVKLGLVAVLLAYHLLCGRIRKQLAAGTCTWTSPQLRHVERAGDAAAGGHRDAGGVQDPVQRRLGHPGPGRLRRRPGAAVRLLRKRAAG